MSSISATGVWQDTADVPQALAVTLDAANGFAEVADLLRRPGIRRIVVSGNGASFHTAHALWLASMAAPAPVDVLGIPAGLLCNGGFSWREGDVLLAVSSSGAFRDVRVAIDDRRRPALPYAAITAHPAAPIPAGAGAVAVNHVPKNRAVTHTIDFCGNTAIALAVWARVCGDQTLADAVRGLPEAVDAALSETGHWAERLGDLGTPSVVVPFGTLCAWTAALQTALMVKEIASIWSEGFETREAATSAMTAAAPGQLFVALPTGPDPLIDEAARLVRGRGATCITAPGGARADARLAAITTFPAQIALSVALGLFTGTDIDRPGWIDSYYTTARVADPA